jgi:hypothetical protein
VTVRELAATMSVVALTDDGDRPLTPAERTRYVANRDTWLRAASLRSLGMLTADWLTSRNLYLPAYGATCPDPETRPLIPTLAAVNRAGLVTDCSQPGHDATEGYDGWMWQQLAAVSGFCDERTAVSLDDAFAGVDGLYFYAWVPGTKFPRSRRDGELFDIPATIRENPDTGEGWVTTVFGPPLSPRAVRSIYRGALSRAAVKTLQGAWQVTLADTQYGRNDLLWPLLDKWAAGEIS